MGRPKKKSTEEIIKNAVKTGAKEVAREAAREAVQALHGADDDDAGEGEENSIQSLFSHSSEAASRESVEDHDKDVFSEGNQHAVNGTPCYFEIRKNGNYVGTEYPPFTIQELTKKYCKYREMTHFKVYLKSTENSRIMTYQTMRVEKLDKDEGVPIAGEQAAPALSPQSIAEIIATSQERTKKDIMEMLSPQLNRPQGPAMSDQLIELAKVLTPLLITKKDDSGMKDILNEMRLSNERMQNAFERKIERLEAEIKDAKRGDSSFGPKDILVLQKEAREEGYEFFKNMRETIESIAEKKAESETEAEPTDWISKILSSSAKLLDHQIGKQETRYPSYRQLERKAAPTRPQLPVRRAPVAPVKKPESVSPEASISAAAPVNENPPASPVSSVSHEPQGLARRVVEEPTVNPGTKEKVLDLLTPMIGEALLASKEPEAAARDVKNLLVKSGVSLDEALNSITVDDVLARSHANGLPAAADAWLTQLYDTLMEDDGQEEAPLVSNA